MKKSVKISNVDGLRCSMLMEKCGGADKKFDEKKNFDLSSLPPLEVGLCKHVKRVNYQVAIWKRGHVQNTENPSPTDDNGWVMVNGRIEPMRYKGERLPPQLREPTSCRITTMRMRQTVEVMPNSSMMRMEAIVTVTMIKKCAMIPRFFKLLHCESIKVGHERSEVL